MTAPQGSSKGEQAAALFGQGYNCCQAVAGAFASETGMDPRTLLCLASSFGGGVGRLREICGAVSGMAIVAGLLWGYSDPAAPNAQEEKAAHYLLIQELAGRFREQNGSILCRELLAGQEGLEGNLPQPRTEAYYRSRPCGELVACAAALLEAKIAERKGELR